MKHISRGPALAAIIAIAVSGVTAIRAEAQQNAYVVNPLVSDQAARRSAAPGSSSHAASMPGVWEPCPGARSASTSLREHCEVGFARCKRL